MRADEMARAGIALLDRMAGKPGGVLIALDPVERVRVVSDIGALADRAGSARTDAEAMSVAADAYRLVEASPALSQLLLPGAGRKTSASDAVFRTVTPEDDPSTDEKTPPQSRVIDIRNHMVRCRESFERALQGFDRSGDE
jgi:hypothetical protein